MVLVGMALTAETAFSPCSQLPAFDPSNHPLADQVQEVHATIGWIIVAVAGLHAAAALFHRIIWHDGVLGRMLPAGRTRQAFADPANAGGVSTRTADALTLKTVFNNAGVLTEFGGTAYLTRFETVTAGPCHDTADWTDLIGTTWSLGPHPVAVRTQARAILVHLAPFSEAVSEETVRAWIAPITASVANPWRKDQAAAWFAALMMVLDGLPVGAFTEATQRDLLRRGTHWPSAAEVYAVLRRPVRASWTTSPACNGSLRRRSGWRGTDNERRTRHRRPFPRL